MNVGQNTHKIVGVDHMIHDTRSIGALVEMIRARCWRLKQLDIRTKRARHPGVAAGAAAAPADLDADTFTAIGVSYSTEAREMLVCGPLLMCSWTFKTHGLADVGFPSEAGAARGCFKRTST